MDEKNYQDLVEALNYCKEDSEEELEIYEKIVAICEEDISAMRDDLKDDGTRGFMPVYLDQFAAPIDNLSRIYMQKGEYAKALSLLEQALPIYRVLELYNPNYTYQRFYALKAMCECLYKLGKEKMAILYNYELNHLQTVVIEPRKNIK